MCLVAQRIECLNAVNNVWSVLDVAGVVYEKHIIMKGTEAINKRAKVYRAPHGHTTHSTQLIPADSQFGGANNNREMAVETRK